MDSSGRGWTRKENGRRGGGFCIARETGISTLKNEGELYIGKRESSSTSEEEVDYGKPAEGHG